MTAAPLSLADTQNVLRTLITAPEGPAAWLAKHPECPLPVAPSATLRPIERVEIYATMYSARIAEALREDFPAIAASMTASAFDAFARAYLIAYPPAHFSLRYAGQHMADFCRISPLCEHLPWAADSAQFAWALITCFDAADAPLVHAQDLQALPPELWPMLHIQRIPASELLELEWNVEALHTAAQQGEPLPEAQRDTHSLCVWRPTHDVKYRTITQEEHMLLLMLQDGRQFEDFCDHAIRIYGNDVATVKILQHVQQWVGDGLLRSAT